MFIIAETPEAFKYFRLNFGKFSVMDKQMV